MTVIQQIITHFLEKAIYQEDIELAENGRFLDDDEFEEKYSRKKIAVYQRLIEKVESWDWECQTLSIELEIEELVAKLNRLLIVRFTRLRLLPTRLRIPEPRIEVLQPLTGRAPPPVAIFVPIPHKLEMGSCARSDLADSAYLI